MIKIKKEYYKNKEWLINKYKKVGSTTIAKECGVCDSTIIYYLNKFGIQKRTRSESLTLTQNRKYQINETYFEKIDTNRKAFWLGFLMADGTMREYKTGKFLLSLEVSEVDKFLLENFTKDIGYSGEVSVEERCDMKGTPRARFHIANQKFCKHLLNKGICPNKTGKEIFPKCIPNVFKRDFIRGFFDGDGSIMISHRDRYRIRFHLVSCSFNILNEIKNEMEKNSIKFSKQSLHLKTNSDKIYELETSNLPNVNNIFKFMYYENCICLKRKSDKFKRFNDYYINHSKKSKNKNFNKTTERYSPNFTEM